MVYPSVVSASHIIIISSTHRLGRFLGMSGARRNSVDRAQPNRKKKKQHNGEKKMEIKDNVMDVNITSHESERLATQLKPN